MAQVLGGVFGGSTLFTLVHKIFQVYRNNLKSYLHGGTEGAN
jgi:hypothetical protein